MNTEKKKYTFGFLVKRFFFLLMLGLIVGVACGIVGTAFSHSVTLVTNIRMANSWIIYLLPLAGLLSVYLYHVFKVTNVGTDDAVESAHSAKQVSPRLTPAVFICSVITHFFGGSAGREGAALKMGGGIAALFSKVFKLDERSRRTIALAGMSGVFAAVFGTPIGAAIFTIEVVRSRSIRPWAAFTALISSCTAFAIAILCKVEPERYDFGALPAFEWSNIWKILVLCALAGILSYIFCVSVHHFPHLVKKVIKNDYVRIFALSVIIVLLTVIVGTTDYNGGGIHIIHGLFHGDSVGYEAFALKLLFTAFTVAAGFKGGEIVPAFFVGATFGAAAATLLGLPPMFGTALGMVALFCGVTNCPIATLILACEMFGVGGIVFYLIAVIISFLLSGELSLYDGKKYPFKELMKEKVEE